MNRREFLKWIGVTTTLVAFPRAIWTPKGMVEWDEGIVINPKCREHLLEIIKNISPADTLHMTGFSVVPLHDIRYEWVVDGLE